jgi:pimeloyl-ACP methyl ester carboxylesterase
VFALWPRPREEFDVETATATTRVHAYRPNPDGAPVVLLPAAGFNASMWYPHVEALASAAWLDELLARLGGRPAHLIGASYGGWVAMNQAIRAPARVASITLLDPAGLTRLDARFWWWLNVNGLASLTPMPLRRRLGRWLGSPMMLERELMTLMWAGIRGYRMEPKFPAILTDDQLRAIPVPVLVITGARSALITPAQARDRAAQMHDAEVAVVPGSHGGFDRISELNDRMTAFIEARS